MLKLTVAMALLAAGLASTGLAARASAPYEGYNYNYWGEPVPAPIAYEPGGVISGHTLGIGGFRAPEDLFVAPDGRVYIADTGNSRIVVLKPDLTVEREIAGFLNEGAAETFNAPRGLYVTESGELYVADTGNRRIVLLDAAGELIRVIESPQSEILQANFIFTPVKVAADKAKRVYVVAQGAFDGIMEFDADGAFAGFVGTNRVRFDPIDYFWKSIATDAQRQRMELFIPTEYTNVDLDAAGFIYTTNSDANTPTPIKRLNPTGVDVLRRQGYYIPQGDLRFLRIGEGSGPSLFVDIHVGDDGIYSALDARRGKVFTYDWDGNLLYIFGKMGDQVGTFRAPVALDRLGNAILVLDRDMNRITRFEETHYGALINEAVSLHFRGDDVRSADVWREVIQYDANFDVAYLGISKALLRQGRNKEAAAYAKLGMDREIHSKAFQRYRKEVLREHLGDAMSAVALAALLAWIWTLLRNRKRRRGTYHA
ncbi:gluconolactonase [Paenibacillus antri]|uniref:Gluconolactonase n=2 Tax=Paenibacillus antri TaxID=2582848 RepID=A0A5R9GA81_9BACL|nr:gluconolactonase [Paenibacillus antri]